MTRREKILKTLEVGELSCAELCDIIAEEDLFKDNKKPARHNSFSHYMKNLNASLSGILNKMVRRAEIEISDSKGPKGGKIYKLKNI